MYRTFAETGRAPVAREIAHRLSLSLDDLQLAYSRIALRRLLVLDPDGLTIRMAPPFSGVPTIHRVFVAGVEYFANCAWDALGIPAALHGPGIVRSQCGQSREPLTLEVGTQGPEASSWLFHCLVPAARWWEDIVFT